MLSFEKAMEKYEEYEKEERFTLLEKIKKEETWNDESIENLYKLCDSLNIAYKYEFSEDEKSWFEEQGFTQNKIEEIRKEEEERNFMFPDDLLFRCENAIKRLYPEGE